MTSEARRSEPAIEPSGWIGRGAVLYDTRPADRRRCCGNDDRQRHLMHVTAIFEEIATGEVLVAIEDGTHTTRERFHLDDVLAMFEPAGFTIDTGLKPTYVLTRARGVTDGHDLMQRRGGAA